MFFLVFRSSASLYLNRSHRLTHRTFISIGHASLFVDRFRRSLRFCHGEFDKEAISDGFMAHYRVLGGGGVADFM